MTALWSIYLLGVLVGLIGVDGTLATKTGVALTWPLGVLAFVLTIAMLVIVAAMAFPVFGAVLVATSIAAWLLA